MRLDGKAKIMMAAFVFQVMFCMGMCWWAALKEQEAATGLKNQQSEYYQFIYQFHTQMETDMAIQ